MKHENINTNKQTNKKGSLKIIDVLEYFISKIRKIYDHYCIRTKILLKIARSQSNNFIFLYLFIEGLC